MNMFANKVVLITGGGLGIGAATAECFVKEGAYVAIVDRNEAKMKDVAQRCQQLGANVLIIKADISKDDEAKAIVQQTIDKYGKLDVLVNNVGITKFARVFDNHVLEVFDEIINTNLRPVILITNLAIPYLKETKGNIVNVSSVGSTIIGFPGVSAYNISKAGIDTFTRCSASELASFGVRVNCVNPGPVATDMLRNTKIPDYVPRPSEGLERISPLGRTSESKEIGNLILYLASDKARSITGSSYVIDNGVKLM